MSCLIACATAEGRTFQICCFAAEHLVSSGYSGELLTVAMPGVWRIAGLTQTLVGFGPAGRVRPAVIACARARGAGLSRTRTLYLQVPVPVPVSAAVSAAGYDPRGWAETAPIADGFAGDPGHVPGRPEQSAGAVRFTQYDVFRTRAMRWIAHQKGQEVYPGGDKEDTDRDGLQALLDARIAWTRCATPCKMPRTATASGAVSWCFRSRNRTSLTGAVVARVCLSGRKARWPVPGRQAACRALLRRSGGLALPARSP